MGKSPFVEDLPQPRVRAFPIDSDCPLVEFNPVRIVQIKVLKRTFEFNCGLAIELSIRLNPQ